MLETSRKCWNSFRLHKCPRGIVVIPIHIVNLKRRFEVEARAIKVSDTNKSSNK